MSRLCRSIRYSRQGDGFDKFEYDTYEYVWPTFLCVAHGGRRTAGMCHKCLAQRIESKKPPGGSLCPAALTEDGVAVERRYCARKGKGHKACGRGLCAHGIRNFNSCDECGRKIQVSSKRRRRG